MTILDFVFNDEEKFVTHEKSGLMLDYDFVLLFEDEQVNNLVVAIAGEEIPEDVLHNLREIIAETSE
jgi:hypothetical protein